MAQKIFISYRRQDTAANALSIGQYLENEFGRKNVFIDVDMRAGVKFPAVLEQRLAECKVMLVLIGPTWLEARDDQGNRRLDSSDDWVRLEIAHALKRNITVIPVRVNGAELPARTVLPEDIRGLLDHQAASVTLAGFRHEMAGLVRDIRSISGNRSWQRHTVMAAGLVLLLLTVSVFLQFPDAMKRVRLMIVSAGWSEIKQDDIWDTKPGEWVFYGTVGQSPIQLAYQFKPASVRILGDRVSVDVRFALGPPPRSTIGNATPQGVYEEITDVIDCKNAVGNVRKDCL